MKRLAFVIILLSIGSSLLAQERKPKRSTKELNPDTLLNFQLDSAITVTGKYGLNVDDFINEILNDSVFYQGFKKQRITVFMLKMML